MGNFWERQRAKVQPPQQAVQPAQGPWWAEGSQLLGQRQTVAQESAQSRAEASQETSPNVIDGHDVSKARVLQGGAEECPMCPPDPNTGLRGNMFRPSPSSAMRCFDCGYMDNNRFLGETVGMSAVAEGPAYKARQTVSGGAVVNNYQGGVKNPGDPRIVGRIG